MREEDVTIDAGAVRLAGTLSLPAGDGPWPVVLCLHGSGPADRNENSSRAKLNVFNVFAADLARRGIATLRYDKRGYGASTGDYYAAGHDDLLSDGAACLDWLGRDGRFAGRFALGHSEGTLLAAKLSLSHQLAGIVLLSPFWSPLGDVMVAQASEIETMMRNRRGLGGAIFRLFARVFGSPAEQQRRIIERAERSEGPVMHVMLQKFPAKWLRETMAIDPATVYRQVTARTLAVGGAKDLQCDPADAARIATAIGPAATAVVVDDLTHLLRRDPEPASLAAYPRLLRQPIDAGLVALVGEWLAGEVSSRP